MKLGGWIGLLVGGLWAIGMLVDTVVRVRAVKQNQEFTARRK